MQPEAVPTQGETLTQWRGETVKIVRIEKAQDIPLASKKYRHPYAQSKRLWVCGEFLNPNCQSQWEPVGAPSTEVIEFIL